MTLLALTASALLGAGCAWNQPAAGGSISTLPILDGLVRREQAAFDRSNILGCWVSMSRDDQGRLRRAVTERFVNGTFRLEYQLRTDDGLVGGTEVGEWGLSGPVLFTLTRAVSIGKPALAVAESTDGNFEDAYLIDTLTDSELVYRDASTGQRLRQTRPIGACAIPGELV